MILSVFRLVFTAIFILIRANNLPKEALVSIVKIPKTLISALSELTTSVQQTFVLPSPISEAAVMYTPLHVVLGGVGLLIWKGMNLAASSW